MARWGCPLCGEHHELVFHSYPRRWSCGSDGVRRHILVVVILCHISRRTGRPYTRRMLPEHLIPRSPLQSAKLGKLLEGKMKPGLTEDACEALGCIDPRTARKHIHALCAAADAKLPILAELCAGAPGPDPVFPPGTNPFVILALLWDRFLATARGHSGSTVSEALRPLLWLGPGLQTFRLFNRSCIPIQSWPR